MQRLIHKARETKIHPLVITKVSKIVQSDYYQASDVCKALFITWRGIKDLKRRGIHPNWISIHDVEYADGKIRYNVIFVNRQGLLCLLIQSASIKSNSDILFPILNKIVSSVKFSNEYGLLLERKIVPNGV